MPAQARLWRVAGHLFPTSSTSTTRLYSCCTGAPVARVIAEPAHLGAGLLPLQLAAQYKADDVVVGELLKVYPDATRVKNPEGKFPARVAFECAGSDGVQDQILVVFPGAAEEKDDAGKILLHYAAEKQASDAIVQSMLTAYHHGAQVKSGGGSRVPAW